MKARRAPALPAATAAIAAVAAVASCASDEAAPLLPDVVAPGARDAAGAPADAAVAEGGRPDGGAVALPFGVNALVLPGATDADPPLPLYRLRTPRGATTAIAFQQAGPRVIARDQDGATIWSAELGEGALFGGFDADDDGVPDLALVRAKALATPCYGNPLQERAIDVVRGATGEVIRDVTKPLPDVCWTFGYATEQWSVLAGLFGGGTKDLVLVPQYTATNENALTPYAEGKAFVARLDGATFTARGTMTMPTVPAYDAFPASRPEPHGSGTDYYAASHVPNGLVLGSGANARLLFFTSGRVVQYSMTPPFDLLADRPYLTGGRTDLVGRNYGLVMPDPKRPDTVALVAGATAFALSEDMRTGTMAFDRYGGIERHVSVYDAAANTVDDRFYSYAHDGNDAFLYEGRVAHPNGVWLAAKDATASRLVFDVYQGGHWHVVITDPGKTSTAVDLKDLFVWDVRDLDGDGEPEVIGSPVRDATDPNTDGWYFPKRRTVVFRWDEAAKALAPKATFEGALPWLVASFRDATRSSSAGFLWPVLTVDRGGKPALVLRRSDGTRQLVPVP
jgi:hypothetical protein